MCGNDQVAGHLTVQVGDPIGVDIEDNDDPTDATPRNNGFDDVDSEEPSVSSSSSPPHFSETDHSQSQTSTHRKGRKSGGRRARNAYADALYEVAKSIRELASALKTNKSISFATELAKECMKFKAYGYSNWEIARAYDYLMANDSKALAFYGKNDELRKLWVEDFIGLPKHRI